MMHLWAPRKANEAATGLTSCIAVTHEMMLIFPHQANRHTRETRKCSYSSDFLKICH